MTINIREPLYSTERGIVVGIRDKYVYQAQIRREPLIIKCGEYSGSFDPKQVKKNPTIKKVFLIPDEPMILYKVFLPKKEKQEKKIKEMARFGVFG